LRGAKKIPSLVNASEARQSLPFYEIVPLPLAARNGGLPRRWAPRNENLYGIATLCPQ